MKTLSVKGTVLKAVLMVGWLAVFIGYYAAMYRGNTNNMSSYSLMILILTFGCVEIGGGFWSKEKQENVFFNILAKLNCVLLVVWFITIAAGILMS